MGLGKGTVIAGLVAFGIAGIAFASGGDGDGREPWTKPIAPAQTPEEIAAVKQAMCTCYRGGAIQLGTLVRCSLQQVYADVPWETHMGEVEGDHPSLAAVRSQFVELAKTLLAVAPAGLDQWCGEIVGPPPPKDDDDVLPPPPPPDKKKKLLELWTDLESDSEEPGKFFRIAKGHAGIERAAKNALEAAGADLSVQGSFNALVRPYMKALSEGAKWNRKLYARTAKENEQWYSFEGKHIGPAWLPRNADAKAAVLTGKMPERTITATGGKLPGGFTYGTPYMPEVDRDLLAQGVLSIVAVDPPEELLELLDV